MKKEDTSWVSEKEESPSYHRNIKENLKHRLNLLSKKKKEESEWDIFYQEEPMFPPSDQEGAEGFENATESSEKSLPEQLFETLSRFIKVFESDPEKEAFDKEKEAFYQGKEAFDEFDEDDPEQKAARRQIKKNVKLGGGNKFAPKKKNVENTASETSDFLGDSSKSATDFGKSVGSEFEKTGDIEIPSAEGNMFKRLYDLFMIVFKLMGKGGNIIYEYLIYIPEKINEYLDKISNALFDAFSSDLDEKFRLNDVNIMKYLVWCITAFLFTATTVGPNLFAFCASKASLENGILHKVDDFTGFTKYTFGLLLMPARHLDRGLWMFAKAIGTMPKLLQYLVVILVSYLIVSKFSIYDELKAMMKGRNTKFKTVMLVWIFSVCMISYIFNILSGLGMLGPAFSLGLIAMMLVIIVCIIIVTLFANTMALISVAFLLSVLIFGKQILKVSDEDIKNYISLVDKYSDCPEPTTTYQFVIEFLKEYISKPETVHTILFYFTSLDMVINAFNHIKSRDLKITFISFVVVTGLLYGWFLIFGSHIPQNLAMYMVTPFFHTIDHIKKSFFTPVTPAS